MIRQALSIELIDDCIFSARAATEGGHESLDRIPGAALLGAAAGRLYRHLDRRDAFAAFHSGRLRFGDGLPWNGRQVTYPVPFAWHHAKGDRPDADGQLRSERIYNFLHAQRIDRHGQKDVQPKQMRDGYVGADGTWMKPAHALRMKTAIDPTTGRAAESQLFGYDALAKGQVFATLIEAEEDFDGGLFQQAVAALTGDVLLGRSRSAEYGRARIAPIEFAPPLLETIDSNRLVLWLLSDLAVADASGQPTLTPGASSLGLPGASIAWDRTFLRSRRYSPWNAARHGYDRERLVLAAGGVITVELQRPLTEPESARLYAGIGLHREAGLGRLWVNPSLLTDQQPKFEPVEESAVRATPPKSDDPQPDDPLIAWLKQQSGDWKAEAEEKARNLAEEYRRQVERARRAAGVPWDRNFGPSKSQWGRLFETAREKVGQALFDALFEGNSAVIKPKAEGWQEEVPAGDGKWTTLSGWLKQKLEFTGDPAAYAHLVRRLAHRVRQDIDKRRA